MEVVHHLNPYTTIPILEPHNDPSYYLSNWHQLLSPYGPLFTLMTFALVPLGVAASFWAIKAILAAVSLGTIFLVWKCARLLGRDPIAAIVLVGLNPIVLVWGLGGDHNDFLMVFCIMLGFYLLLRSGAWVAGEAAGGGGSRQVGRSEDRAGWRHGSVLGWLWPLAPLETRRGHGVRGRGGDQGLGGDPDSRGAGGAAEGAAPRRADRCSAWSRRASAWPWRA